MGLFRGILGGAAAGAAGTTALAVASGIDAFVRGRPASDAPARLVGTVLDRAGVQVPGGRGERGNRLAALGPLAGAATGVTLGALVGGLRARGFRLPAPLGGALLGAAAMAAADVPLAAAGVSDPRSWSAADWTGDALAHLAYGVTTKRVLDALPSTAITPPWPTVRASTLLRAAALGAATGARSSAGVTALAVTSRPTDSGRIAGWSGSRTGRVLAATAATGELVADKLPATPARTESPGLVPRAVLGATAAVGMAGRAGERPDLPLLVGVGAAVAAAFLGERLRAGMADRFGSDLPGAVIEDVAAALLGFLGARR